MKDEVFKREKDVPMTKEEIRYLSLGYLELAFAKTLLDIGSGTGSVSIEAAAMNPHLQVTAVECDEDAFLLSLENKDRLDKVMNLKDRIRFIHDKAPSSKISGGFDRIFIGGTKGNPKEVIEWAYGLLEENGILVMNFITLENFQRSVEAIEKIEGFTKIEGSLCSISKLTDLGPYTYFKPHNPAFIIKTTRRK